MNEIYRKARHMLVNGVRLHYVHFSSGKSPLILLPGITAPAATWEFVARRLALHHDVYVLDARGRGLSEGGSDKSYRLDDYAMDVEQLVKQLDLRQPHIVGHSMGARIAVRLASTYPAVLGKLVIVDPPVSGPGRRPYPIPLEFYLDSLASVENGEGFDQMRKSFDWTDDQLEMRMEWLPTCDRTAIADSHRSFHEEDIHGDMPSITADTLLLYAERGGTVLPEEAEEICRLIPQCKSQRIDDAGHMIPWDQLDEFIDAVNDFCIEVPLGGSSQTLRHPS
jgi:N-formylmaleamate deformylase